MSQQEKGNARVVCPVDGAFCASSMCWTGHCHEQRGATTQAPQPKNPTAGKLKQRLARLDEIEASYLRYLQDRIAERDWHGGWDACVNLSEVSCERDGLLYALEALGEKP